MTHMLIFEIILLIYFVYVTLYSFTLAVEVQFFKSPDTTASASIRKFAVLIPSFKEDAVIVSVAEQALKQNYPVGSFDIVIIADSLKPETVLKLKSLPIMVVEVVFEKSTKVKSLNYAMTEIGDN